MVGRNFFAFVVMLYAGSAAADPNKPLADAKKAIDAVRYNDAQPLLVAALQAGGASPGELVEIYRLSASTAIVLGHPDSAELYYRRWLALDPHGSLPDTVAPKLRDPFVAAQAYMAAHGRLSAKAQRKAGKLDVVIASDPLAMVASVTIDAAGASVPPKQPIGADGAVHVELAASASVRGVAVLDEFGNHLVDLAASDIATIGGDVPAVPPVAPAIETKPAGDDGGDHPIIAEPVPVSFVRRPLVWGVPALVFAVAGVAFGSLARGEQSTATSIAEHAGEHFASDLDDARRARDRDALIANLGFGAAGACAVVALIMFATAPASAPAPAPVTVAPTAGGATAVLTLHF